MFNQYPYLNLNDLNLDYLLNEIKSMYNEVTNFVSINAIKYADPIQWNITSQYEKNTVVIDPLTGTAYISVAAVPSGVALTRTEYWTVVFDLGSFVTRAAQNFTSHWESDTTLTATFSTSMGGWLVWGDVLYKALTNITAGDSYVVGGNIEHFTIEDLYNSYLNTVANILALLGDLTNLQTANKDSIVDAINEIVGTIGDLSALTTTDKDSLVDAINEVITNLNTEISDRENADTNLQNQIDDIHPIDYKMISNSSGALTHLMQVAKTYIDHNDELSYGNYNTLFSTSCVQVNSKWVIDCSSFVEACLKGITFDNSRYNGNTNNVLGIGYDFQEEIVSGPDEVPYRPYGMVSSAMYHYCELRGYNYEIDSIDRIEVGDLVFLANNPNQYKSIGHVGFVINIRKGVNSIVLLDASDDRTPVIQTTVISLDSGTTAIYGARFPLPYMPFNNINLLNNGRNTTTSKTFNFPSGAVGATENLFLITNTALKAKTVYSFIMVLPAPLPSDIEMAIMAQVNGSFTYLAGARFDTLEGGHIVRGSFYTPPLFASSFADNHYSIRLRMLRTGSTSSTRTETLNIKWYGLYEGISNETIENNDQPASDDIITKSAPYETENVVANITDLTAAITNYATSGIDWSRQFHVIRVSSNITLDDSTLVRSGRYIIDGLSYATGNYGGFLMRCVSGAHIIISCAINNGTVSFAGVISTL